MRNLFVSVVPLILHLGLLDSKVQAQLTSFENGNLRILSSYLPQYYDENLGVPFEDENISSLDFEDEGEANFAEFEDENMEPTDENIDEAEEDFSVNFTDFTVSDVDIDNVLGQNLLLSGYNGNHGYINPEEDISATITITLDTHDEPTPYSGDADSQTRFQKAVKAAVTRYARNHPTKKCVETPKRKATMLRHQKPRSQNECSRISDISGFCFKYPYHSCCKAATCRDIKLDHPSFCQNRPNHTCCRKSKRKMSDECKEVLYKYPHFCSRHPTNRCCRGIVPQKEKKLTCKSFVKKDPFFCWKNHRHSCCHKSTCSKQLQEDPTHCYFNPNSPCCHGGGKFHRKHNVGTRGTHHHRQHAYVRAITKHRRARNNQVVRCNRILAEHKRFLTAERKRRAALRRRKEIERYQKKRRARYLAKHRYYNQYFNQQKVLNDRKPISKKPVHLKQRKHRLSVEDFNRHHCQKYIKDFKYIPQLKYLPRFQYITADNTF